MGSADTTWDSGDLPTFEEFQGMSPYERAALRTNAESGGMPWETAAFLLRNQWGQQGQTETPDVTALQAMGANPEERIGSEQLASTFGERPENYWARMGKNWRNAAGPQVSVAA